MYFTAVSDWSSRYVLSWRLSHTLEGRFCLEALDEALARRRPEIFPTDQGAQFTSREYPGRLEAAGVAVSRDGRGRAGTTCSGSACGEVINNNVIILHIINMFQSWSRACGLPSGSPRRSVPLNRSMTGPPARSIGPGPVETRGELSGEGP